jgi:putative ABC transport system substrate-binding protein
MRAPRRRLVFAILGLATAMVAGGPMVQAQTSSRLPLIAVLEPGPASPPSPALAWMRDALAKHDWVEGRTARFETRYGDWQPDRMAAMVRELIALKPEVIYTHSTVAVGVAAKATTSIPIVAGAASDLIDMGVVRSLAQPGGNVTGMTLTMPDPDRKRLEVLKEALPFAVRVADLFDPGATREAALRAGDDSARLLGVRLQRIAVREPGQIESAFDDMVKARAKAVFIGTPPCWRRMWTGSRGWPSNIGYRPSPKPLASLRAAGSSSTARKFRRYSGTAPPTWTRS